MSHTVTQNSQKEEEREMRCYFCGGNIWREMRCIHCGRSTDIEYELYVMRESKKEHKNWHGLSLPAFRKVMKRRQKDVKA